MGLQLIFVVETDKKCKSDWIYIKDTIDQFFQYDNASIKLTPIYMDGKGRYKNKEKEIESLKKQYAASNKSNQSEVIYCFDCDDYDSKPEDLTFLNEAQRYCNKKGYEFVWFCKDIERVYLGKKVPDNEKKKEAEQFKKNKKIKNVAKSKLSLSRYQANTSNIVNIIGKFLTKKD